MNLMQWLFSRRAYVSIRMYMADYDLPVFVTVKGMSADISIAIASAMEMSSEFEKAVHEAVGLLDDERKKGTRIVATPPGSSTVTS